MLASLHTCFATDHCLAHAQKRQCSTASEAARCCDTMPSHLAVSCHAPHTVYCAKDLTISSWTSRQLSRVPLMMAFFHIVCLAKGMCTWLTACVHVQLPSLLYTSDILTSPEYLHFQPLVSKQLHPFSGATF